MNAIKQEKTFFFEKISAFELQRKKDAFESL